ncbi:MAG: dihydrodipicolinate synthase family protein [Fimbriimonadaceae bacterium]|nr:dihydrodipicolinate synthase family protein [Fimbriimonadaceae bacterium]
MHWHGVFPAITTPFKPDLIIDHEFLAKHVKWLVEAGCKGIVPLGSLGEAATLTFDEKVAILETCVEAVQVPIVAGVSGLSTKEAVELAKAAKGAGCQGLMVLPPYVYRGDWRETRAHLEAIISATNLSCMLYNNPIAYGTDILPTQIAELAAHANLHAVKESSADIRRVTAIREILGDRLAIFVGVDDILLEGVEAGAVGWIAGLVSAFPKESVDLFNFAMEGRIQEARGLYEWFLPLLRLDTVPKFVQLIKLVQEEVGMGSERVRPPRLELVGPDREATLALIRDCIARRPT